MIKTSNNPSDILENYYRIAVQVIEEKRLESIPKDIKESIDPFILRIDSNKSLLQAIVSSILKKKISPEQDIRLHKEEFPNGYSARGLDTKITSPFFKKYFPKYANKETAFLTMAMRASVVWNFEEGRTLPFRDKKILDPFLNLIDKIQNKL
jgi:DNA (cytosine-5)-methyltransferase 1